jgi:hypothetical protein
MPASVNYFSGVLRATSAAPMDAARPGSTGRFGVVEGWPLSEAISFSTSVTMAGMSPSRAVMSAIASAGVILTVTSIHNRGDTGLGRILVDEPDCV